MPRINSAGLLGLGFLTVLGGHAFAGGTRSFVQTTAKDFEEGEATASTILPSGDVVPGMKATRVPMEAAFVWSSTTSPDGKTAYFGTGDQGHLYAVPAQSSGVPEARKVAELDAPWITSLAVRPDGTILAGTTPGGRVFAVNPSTGAAKPFSKLAGEHVWTLVHDSKSGVTYAGAGGPGKIFAIDAKGGIRLHWDSGDKHVVSLAALGDGKLLAGTSERAIVYRVHPDGRAEALHDFEADEVRAILRVKDATYLAVNDFDKPVDLGAAAAAAGGPAPAKGTRITMGTAPASVGTLPRPSQMKSRSAVYRLADDGTIEQVFSLSDGYLTALTTDGNGDVFAAAGTQGKVYRLLSDRTFALAADLAERQALTLLRAGDGFLVGTGDVGGIYQVRPASNGGASYLSKVFDGQFASTWGRLRWSGSANVNIETRAGNTAKPDKTWTPWTKLENVNHTAGEGEGRIASPGARYLQYRVGFPGQGTVLREAAVFYLPQNQRPRVTDVTADAGGGGAARAHSSTIKLKFKVDNPDGDELVYRLHYRQENESVWRPLGGPDPLTKPEYDWATDSVPDGKYVVSVRASDERSTPADRALDSVLVSPPIQVDNTKPEVVDLVARAPVITGRARDAASVISHIEYAIDGREWRPASPSDGVLDQRSETFTIKLPANLSKGPHVVNVRAFDATDNQGAARVQFEIK